MNLKEKQLSRTQSTKPLLPAKLKKKVYKFNPWGWHEWRYWELMPIRKRKVKK